MRRFVSVAVVLFLGAIAAADEYIPSVTFHSAQRELAPDGSGDEQVDWTGWVQPSPGYAIDSVLIFVGEDIVYSRYYNAWGFLSHEFPSNQLYPLTSDQFPAIEGDAEITIQVNQVDEDFEFGLPWIETYTVGEPE